MAKKTPDSSKPKTEKPKLKLSKTRVPKAKRVLVTGSLEEREKIRQERARRVATPFAAVALEDTDAELRRQAAIASRKSQRRALESAVSALGSKLSDPAEDPQQIMDDIDDLNRAIFMLKAEIADLEASQSMKFLTASQVANVSSAVGDLAARIAASVAASAIMTAATAVISAWA